MQIYGWGSPEVEAINAQARALARTLGDRESEFSALQGLWSNYFLRGEMDPALEIATALEAMAREDGRPVPLLRADHTLGYTLYFRGDAAGALAHARAGFHGYDPALEPEFIRAFGQSSHLCFRSFGLGAAWLLGEAEDLGGGIDGFFRFVDALNHPPSTAHGCATITQNLVMAGDWERVEALARRCAEISDEEGFLLWSAMATQHLGLAEGFLRDPEAGLARAEEGRARFLATGSALTDTLHHPAFGALMIRCGRAEEAAARLTAAAEAAERRRERLNLPEIHRVRGEARRALGDAAGAASDFETAARIAREQKAKPLLARARASLARLEDGSA